MTHLNEHAWREWCPAVVIALGCLNCLRDMASARQYHTGFYLDYMARWPEYCIAMEASDNRLMAYIIGKAEGKGEDHHGHVSAVTVAPEYRRLGLARKLMDEFEGISDEKHDAYFVDLFVRASNKTAIGMYRKLGYVVYRRVLGYYSDDREDAYDMRKSLPLDPGERAMVPLPEPVTPDQIVW